MPYLFEPATVGKITLRNRIVRSATWEGMCDEQGAPTERLVSLYEALAEGAAGREPMNSPCSRIDGIAPWIPGDEKF